MIRFIQAGIQTSVQDLGRHGQRQYGVAQSGALDSSAISQANFLLGNDANDAAIEITIGPVEIIAQTSIAIALVGGDTAAFISRANETSQPVFIGQILQLEENDRVTIQPRGQFARCYLSMPGGVDVAKVMHSRSTDVTAKFGGFQGRCLQKNDVITSRLSHPTDTINGAIANRKGTAARYVKPESSGHLIRIMTGPDYLHLTAASQQALWQNDWQVSINSNRMACPLVDARHTATKPAPHLQLKPEQRAWAQSMPSHAVIPGTIQLPPQGQPIVLLADCQTTGGYPRIGKVIDADLWRLAQMPAKALFRLIECDQASALQALRKQQQMLFRFKLACSR